MYIFHETLLIEIDVKVELKIKTEINIYSPGYN